MTNWAEYDDVFKKLDKDERIGDVTVDVASVDAKTRDDGGEYFEVGLTIVEAGNYRIKMFLPPSRPLPADIQAAIDMGRKDIAKGKRMTAQMFRVLEESYGVNSPAQLKVGDQLSVKTSRGKERKNLTGETRPGFIQVVAILPKGSTSGKASAGNPADVPF